MSRILTTEQILERVQAVNTAEAKAAADPSALDDDDLKILPGETTSRLAAEGKLVHLGLGPPRNTRRTGRSR